MLANSRVNEDGTLASGLRQHKATLGQDDFLQLLVKQMTAQDPMNPQGDTEFIAQMAQFSSLEQTKSMSSDIAMLKAQVKSAAGDKDGFGSEVGTVVDVADPASVAATDGDGASDGAG